MRIPATARRTRAIQSAKRSFGRRVPELSSGTRTVARRCVCCAFPKEFRDLYLGPANWPHRKGIVVGSAPFPTPGAPTTY